MVLPDFAKPSKIRQRKCASVVGVVDLDAYQADSLGERARRRFAELAISRTELAKRSGFSTETLRPLLEGQPGSYRESTLNKLELGLDWEPGSWRMAAAGLPPIVRGVHDDEGRLLTDWENRVEQRLQLLEQALAHYMNLEDAEIIVWPQAAAGAADGSVGPASPDVRGRRPHPDEQPSEFE